MKKHKSDTKEYLALWAAQKTQIKRVVIFNVTKELEPPSGRNPEIQIELLPLEQANPILTSQWDKEIHEILAADTTVLPLGKKIDFSKRSDYVCVYTKTSRNPVARKKRPKRA